MVRGKRKDEKQKSSFFRDFFRPVGGEELLPDSLFEDILSGEGILSEKEETAEEPERPEKKAEIPDMPGPEKGPEEEEEPGDAEGAGEEAPVGASAAKKPGKKPKTKTRKGKKKKKKKRTLWDYANEDFDDDEEETAEPEEPVKKKKRGLFGKKRDEEEELFPEEEETDGKTEGPEPSEEPEPAEETEEPAKAETAEETAEETDAAAGEAEESPEEASGAEESQREEEKPKERGFGAASERYEALKRSLAAGQAASKTEEEPAESPEEPGEETEGPEGTAAEETSGEDEPEEAVETASGEAEDGGAEKEESAGEAKPEKIKLFDGEEETDGEEPIRLFDHDGYEKDLPADRKKKNRESRKAAVATGTGSTAFVNVNATEGLKQAEKTRAEQAEREEKRKRQEAAEREKRRKQKQKTLRNAAGTILLGSAIMVGILAGLYYGFRLSAVEINGNARYSDEYVFKLSGLEMKQHMLTVDLDAVKANIQDDPYLQVDAVTYIFPSRLRINITERKAVAGIVGLDYNVIINDQGYVLDMGMGTDLTGLIRVTGVNMAGFRLGERLGEGDDFSTATLIAIFESLENNELLGSVSSIDLTTPLAITVTVSNGLKVFVGQSTDLDNKFASLKRELPAFLRQNINWGTLFLSAKGGTVYSPREIAQILAEETTEVTDQYGSIGTDSIGSDAVYYGEASSSSSSSSGASVPTQDFKVAADDFQG